MTSADWDGNTEYREIKIVAADGSVIASRSGPKASSWPLPIKIEVEDIDRDEHFSRSIGQALADEAMGEVWRMD
jgi:hypothetical protein